MRCRPDLRATPNQQNMNSDDTLITAILLFALGLPVGSFLNVVAYRVPRGETPWSPARSYCPSCQSQLHAR
ncbi:MAG: prepilin peptidase, partial [Solirubrobacterales bacterium]